MKYLKVNKKEASICSDLIRIIAKIESICSGNCSVPPRFPLQDNAPIPELLGLLVPDS